MADKADKIRALITFPVELKEKLNQVAEQENRSFNNLVITILQEYVQSTDK